MVHVLNKDIIRKHVGPTSYERGEQYQRQGRVRKLELARHELTSQVWGHDVEPYDVSVLLGSKGIVASDCSCPMDSNCKHVAAICLQALVNFADSFSQKPHIQEAVWRPAIPSRIVPPQQIKPKPKKSGQWERQLSSALSVTSALLGTYTLELLFGVVIPKRQSWEPKSESLFELQLRPLLRNKQNGKTSLSLLPWTELRYESAYERVGQLLGA